MTCEALLLHKLRKVSQLVGASSGSCQYGTVCYDLLPLERLGACPLEQGSAPYP
jgi:hypothetical protein